MSKQLEVTCLALCGLFFTLNSFAHELTTKISFEAEHTDNALLLGPSNEVSETTYKPGLEMDYQLDYSTVAATLNYKFEQENYQHDTFQDRNQFTGTGDLTWSVVNDRLTWAVFQNRSRLALDRQNAETPSNDVIRSIIQTGPTFHFKLGSIEAQLSALYANNSFDDGLVTDSNQTKYAFNLNQKIAETHTIGLFIQSAKIRFDGLAPDYDSRRYGVSYSNTGRVISYNLSIGQNETESGAQGKNRGLFYSAALKVVFPELDWTFTTNRELTDTNNGLSLNPNARGDLGSQGDLGNGDGNFDRFDIVDRRRHTLTINSRQVRTNVFLTIYQDLQKYQTLANDEETRGANFQISYKGSERVTYLYQLQFEGNQLTLAPGLIDEYDQIKHRIQVNYRLNTKLSLSAWLALEDRNYDLATREDYKELSTGARIGITL